jgi:hypothetical protein
MDSFGNVIGRVIAEIITLIEGTLSHYVDITSVGGNITNVSLSAGGELFCLNWANLMTSFAGAMNAMMTVLWNTNSA